MNNTWVLLVDDEEEFLDVLADRLTARDLKVDTAVNGEIAIEKAAQKEYDAILLDMAMPGLSGLETLRRLLEINADLQIILLTGQSTLSQAVDAMKEGALDFLEKPADMEILVDRIETAATNKTRLMDQRIEERLSDIMRKKGW